MIYLTDNGGQLASFADWQIKVSSSSVVSLHHSLILSVAVEFLFFLVLFIAILWRIWRV